MERFLNQFLNETDSDEIRSAAEPVPIETIIIEANDSSSSETPEYSNPWPYIEKYFKFIGSRGKESLEFQCLLCKPNIKKLSVNRRSQFNLKKHIKSVHAHTHETFLSCISAGSQRSRSKRKGTSHGGDEVLMKRKSNETQLTLKQSFQAGPRFSKANYENKVFSHDKILVLIRLCHLVK